MHWLLILIFKSTIKFVGRHKNHAGWYIMWLFPVDYNFTALWWLMVIVERVVMVVKYLWGLFFHMKSLFAHRYVSQRYRRKVNRVRTESWILEKVLTFATSFPDLEKVWKIKIKSGKNGKKSGVFLAFLLTYQLSCYPKLSQKMGMCCSLIEVSTPTFNPNNWAFTSTFGRAVRYPAIFIHLNSPGTCWQLT